MARTARAGRDHPRMRGVYTKAGTKGRLARGSSPHARGLPGHRDQRHGDLTDHPRMRGVYVGCQSLWRALAGSSPHARGLRDDESWRYSDRWIIPACAGFTALRRRIMGGLGDHPRMRGVYPENRPDHRHSRGSSPHARGLRAPARTPAPSTRIIPACAGFTAKGRRWCFRRPDHPRMRGVYSPTGRAAARRAGIIPACAGFTLDTGPETGGGRDHPRMRGVYPTHHLRNDHQRGSSPHARGLRGARISEFTIPRIIPACAGFTLGDPWNPNGPGAYHPPVSFTADLVPARQSCGSAAVEPRWTTTPWAA